MSALDISVQPRPDQTGDDEVARILADPGFGVKFTDHMLTVEWTPDYMGKRMADWLRNMGDWNISRRRYYGLPLPFYPCSCGHLNVIGSKAELLERSTSAVREEDLPELHRPWIDNVVIACEKCGEPVSRIPEVGDVWLDAGGNPKWDRAIEDPHVKLHLYGKSDAKRARKMGHLTVTGPGAESARGTALEAAQRLGIEPF